MRKSFFLLFASLLFACNGNVKVKSELSGGQPAQTKVEKILLDYMQLHPDWNKNEAFKEDFSGNFCQKLEPEIINGLYEEIPFRLSYYDTYSKEDHIGVFESVNTPFSADRLASKFVIEVYGRMDLSLVNTIDRNTIYYLKGGDIHIRRSGFFIAQYPNGDIKNIYLPDIRMKVESVVPLGH